MEFEKVREIIAEQMNKSEQSITMETSFTEDLGADSLDILQIITALEDEFGVEFSVEDAESVKSVSDAVNYIVSKKA